ncbi:TonB-dependent receptor [Rhabdobacter roseus]|uniref:TonB-linked SusC/RagA family outer membrane protein n=1 Tax=Rhabdobacter roseus TaxID=1655419 RepID=A0A840TW12_9BACT|nr:TonB-dependent receptor [Rhabdobacter roseus]MBB5283829.1 TonB-linked SusC/RagA family outer membrane protein [Rhabdobacter roseus]
MKKYLFTFMTLFWAGLALAQDRVISGRVTSTDDGSSIPGVSILVKGTSVGSTSDTEGNYRINVPTGANTLVFSFVGLLPEEVAIGNRSVINVELRSDIKALSEVVVVGYGTQQRRDVTGSVGTIKGEGIKDMAIPSFDKFLQGQVAGVQASVPSGMLGQPARIRIRGTNSISNSSDPLYVVDGLPYISGDQGGNTTNNPLGDINPNDIESVEVLKDGSATAIYGSRAANGVILITTKRGKLGAPRLTYDGWMAVSQPSKYFDLMNADEFIAITNEKLANANPSLPAAAFPTLNPETGEAYDTDWQRVILRNGFQHNHALSFSGATAQTNYYFSLGFTDMEGNINANNQRRFTFRSKLDQKAFNDKLTFGMNMAVSHTTNTGLNTGTNALSGNVAGAIYAFPNVPVKWPDGSYNLSSDLGSLGPGANTRAIFGNYTNQGFILENNIYKNQSLNLTGNTFIDLEVLEGLHVRSMIGINYLNGEDYMFTHPGHGDGRGVNGRIQQYNLPSFRYNWQNTLSYNKTLGESNLGVVVGLEHQKTRTRWFLAHGTNLSSIYFGENENIISGSLTNQFVGGTASERAFSSVFARANYSLKDRYLLTATVRNDKISSLPHGNQSALLPGVSVGWRISEEDFFKGASGLEFISELKLRGGWAKVGNVEIGNYPYAGIFAAAQYGDWSGLRFNQVGNSNLSFETSNKTNFGLDLSLLSNRISFTAEYFKNDIDNLILQAPTPPSLGIPANQIAQNVGAMYNKGWEFSLTSTNIQAGGFAWRSNFNVTFIKNEVLRLVNDINSAYHVTREGEPIGSFFGYQYHGVNPANGNPIFEKADGSLVQQRVGATTFAVYDPANPAVTNVNAPALTFADKRILGRSNPTWFGGFNNTFTYNNFDLNVFFTYSGGNKVYNVTRQEQLVNQVFGNGGRELLNRWTGEGQVTDVPRLAFLSDANVNQTGHTNSRFLENGSFLRAQNIGLGYTLPSNLRNRIKSNSFRVYAQIQNAFVITKYTGLDPELNSSVTTNQQPGLDNRTNPIPRVYTVGLNLGF